MKDKDGEGVTDDGTEVYRLVLGIEDRLQLLEKKTRSKLSYLLQRIQQLEKKILDIFAE